MVLLPKEGRQAVVAQFSREAAATRPLRLTDTLPKVMALGLNGRMPALAATTVISQQRAVMPGRELADNVFEVVLSFSAVSLRSAVRR